MIKAIIFDLDGVLVETKIIHFNALNESLIKYGFKPITYDAHLKIYDGLPTTEKLNILNLKKSVPKKFNYKIQQYKKKSNLQTPTGRNYKEYKNYIFI